MYANKINYNKTEIYHPTNPVEETRQYNFRKILLKVFI